MWSLFLLSFWRFFYWSTRVPRNLPCPENSWLRSCLRWLLLNFFTESQKEYSLFDKWLSDEKIKCSFPTDFAFGMSIWRSERATQPGTIFPCCHSISIFLVCCVCVKGITLCNCLCSSPSSPSRFSASAIRNIGEFGAKSYFTDHQRANTIHCFTDSVPVLKIYNCY